MIEFNKSRDGAVKVSLSSDSTEDVVNVIGMNGAFYITTLVLKCNE